MRITLRLFCIAFICLTLLASCQSNRAPLAFSFSLEAENASYLRGETVRITANVTNASEEDYVYMGGTGGFFPSIELYFQKEGNAETYFLEHEPVALHLDYKEKTFKVGESGGITYSFPIPENAPLGEYHATLSYGTDSKTFSSIITVTEVTAQNTRESYSYSSLTVCSGEDAVRPIQTLVYTNQYDADDNGMVCADGLGHMAILNDPLVRHSHIPVLVPTGEISVSASDDTPIGSPELYDSNFGKLNIDVTWQELHLLPAGEYVIVFTEKNDTRNTDPDAETYWLTQFENIFRLVILT